MNRLFFCWFLLVFAVSSCNNSAGEITSTTPAGTPVSSTDISTEVTSASSDNCNWAIEGIRGPRTFTCDNKKYVYGIKVSCTSGVYERIFCAKALMNNGLACNQDRSTESLLCYQETIGKHLPR